MYLKLLGGSAPKNATSLYKQIINLQERVNCEHATVFLGVCCWNVPFLKSFGSSLIRNEKKRKRPATAVQPSGQTLKNVFSPKKHFTKAASHSHSKLFCSQFDTGEMMDFFTLVNKSDKQRKKTIRAKKESESPNDMAQKTAQFSKQHSGPDLIS